MQKPTPMLIRLMHMTAWALALAVALAGNRHRGIATAAARGWPPGDSVRGGRAAQPPRATPPSDDNEGEEEEVEGGADEGEDSNRDPRSVIDSRGLGRTCCSTSTRRHQGPPPSHPTFGQLRALQHAKGAWDHIESPLLGGGELPLVGAATR
jgi:hypothetical protein